MIDEALVGFCADASDGSTRFAMSGVRSGVFLRRPSDGVLSLQDGWFGACGPDGWLHESYMGWMEGSAPQLPRWLVETLRHTQPYSRLSGLTHLSRQITVSQLVSSAHLPQTAGIQKAAVWH